MDSSLENKFSLLETGGSTFRGQNRQLWDLPKHKDCTSEHNDAKNNRVARASRRATRKGPHFRGCYVPLFSKITTLAFRQGQRTFECLKMISLSFGWVLIEHNQTIVGALPLIP
jgi:hypothetical protein